MQTSPIAPQWAQPNTQTFIPQTNPPFTQSYAQPINQGFTQPTIPQYSTSIPQAQPQAQSTALIDAFGDFNIDSSSKTKPKGSLWDEAEDLFEKEPGNTRGKDVKHAVYGVNAK